MGTTSATASEMQALQTQYHATVHNLANANTAAYKRRLTVFSQALAQQLASGSQDAPADELVSASCRIYFSQGPLNRTDRPLDLAIEGDGFLVVETPTGPLYTRNGSLRTNTNGQLVDGGGRLVLGDSGQITIPATAAMSKLNIAEDGTLSAAEQQLGKLRIVSFPDAAGLTPVGANCYTAGGQTPTPAKAKVRQGFIEQSNVKTVDELVGLITVSRMYEANAKTLRIQDERTQSLLQVANA